MNIKAWIVAMRLRTLPLSSSAVLLGVVLGGVHAPYTFSWHSYLLAILIMVTAVLLQILSNFANDYGDAKSGVDNEKRVGPKRGLMMGALSMQDMKWGIIVVVLLTMLTGVASIILAFAHNVAFLLCFAGFGILSIIAAITYTVGIVYGYKGLGDLAVFIFFGLLAVMGAEFMMDPSNSPSLLGEVLAMQAGCTAMLVLNVNNLRDYDSDKASGKNSLVVQIGLKWGKIYHLVLLVLALINIILASYIIYLNFYTYYALLILPACFPLLKANMFCYKKENTGAVLDPMLKKTSVSASIINLTFIIILLCSYFATILK